MCLQRDHYYEFVHLIPLAMLEKYENNELVWFCVQIFRIHKKNRDYVDLP